MCLLIFCFVFREKINHKMATHSVAKSTFWLFKMSHEKQDTLLKMSVLTMAAILCMLTDVL